MQDEYSEMQYRDMYEKLRSPEGQRISLRAFVRHINSSLSHAMWGKYDNKPSALTRHMKNELRTAMKLPLLPPTIEEALANVAPGATVVILDGTEGPLNHVVLGNRLDKRWPRLGEVPLANDERMARLGVHWRDVVAVGLANLEVAMNLRGEI